MTDKPLVSIIVSTYNSSKFIRKCLESLAKQDYQEKEIIVVDNFSKDQTAEISREFTDKVYSKGPERSAQRNFGVKQASGQYVCVIDSDMELSPHIISACVEKVINDSEIKELIIPEESFGQGFWAQCKKLERSFYVGVDWMEAARFFEKQVYEELGGYNENMVSGEDWDLSQRAKEKYKISRINEYIFHNEGTIRLSKLLKKKLYYAKKIQSYTATNKNKELIAQQTSLLGRYKLFLSQPKKLFRNPLLGLGVLFMKTSEFFFGGLGLLSQKVFSNGR